MKPAALQRDAISKSVAKPLSNTENDAQSDVSDSTSSDGDASASSSDVTDTFKISWNQLISHIIANLTDAHLEILCMHLIVTHNLAVTSADKLTSPVRAVRALNHFALLDFDYRDPRKFSKCCCQSLGLLYTSIRALVDKYVAERKGQLPMPLKSVKHLPFAGESSAGAFRFDASIDSRLNKLQSSVVKKLKAVRKDVLLVISVRALN